MTSPVLPAPGATPPAPPAPPVPAPVEGATPPAPAPPAPAPATPEYPEGLGDAGKQAIDRMKAERDQAIKDAKANADAAKRLKEIEDRDLSELEKATKRAEELEAQVAAEKAEATRLRVAVKHGIPPEDFDLLGTGTEAEIEARAALIAAKNAAAKTPPPGFDGGVRTPADPTDLPGQIAAAEKAGDRQLARSLKAQQLAEARRKL